MIHALFWRFDTFGLGKDEKWRFGANARIYSVLIDWRSDN